MSLTNRSARSHRSTKLPNVKLRPAPTKDPDSNRRQRQRLAQEEDDSHFRNLLSHNDEEEVDAFTFEKQAVQNKKPLAGLSLCFTQVGELKPVLQQYAVTLGASWSPSLMEFTTHLLAPSPGSEKYNVAIKHAINLMHPDWLSEIRQCWVDDVAFDLEEMTERHRLKPFSGFNICITGFANGNEHSQMVRFIRFLGGNYFSEFDLSGKITHLICSNTIFSGKSIDYKLSRCMTTLNAWKDKYRKTLQQTGEEDQRIEIKSAMKIKCLWQSWIEDCDELQAYIPETHYSTDASPPDLESRRRSMAPIKQCLAARDQKIAEREAKKAKELEEQIADSEQKSVVDDDDKTRIKLKAGISRKTDPKDKGKNLAQDSVGGSAGPAQESVLASIVAANLRAEPQKKEEKNVLNLSRASSFAIQPDASSSSIVHPASFKDKGKGRLLNYQSRTLAEASATPDDRGLVSASGSTLKSTGKGTASPLSAAARKGADPVQVEDAHDSSEAGEEAVNGQLYKGLVMAIDPSLKAKAEPLRKYLEEQGARVVNAEVTELKSRSSLDYYILPIRPAFDVVEAGIPQSLATLVTIQWVNRCDFLQEVVSSDPSNCNCGLKPSLANPNKFPIPGSEQVSVSFTSMSDDGVEANEAKGVLDVLGLKFSESVKRGITTHLIKGSSKRVNSSKESVAKSWGIELVGLDFLNNALQTGTLDPPVNPKSKEVGRPKSFTGSTGSSLNRSISKSNESLNERLNSESMSRNDSLRSVDEEADAEHATKKAVTTSISTMTSASVDQAAAIDRSSTPPKSPSTIIPVSDGATQAAADTIDEVMAMLNDRANSPTSKGRRKVRAPPNRLRNGGNRSSNRNTPTSGLDASDHTTGTGLRNATNENEHTTEDIEALLAAHRKAEALRMSNDSFNFDENNQNNAIKEKEESLRIIYDNPQAAKEKKRLLSIMHKAEQEAAAKRRRSQDRGIEGLARTESFNSSHTEGSSDLRRSFSATIEDSHEKEREQEQGKMSSPSSEPRLQSPTNIQTTSLIDGSKNVDQSAAGPRKSNSARESPYKNAGRPWTNKTIVARKQPGSRR